MVCTSALLPDVTALGSLPYLTHLNMSGNKLTKVLDFDSPKALKVEWGLARIMKSIHWPEQGISWSFDVCFSYI